ncbi:MAG: hypothetical protein RBU23_03780 [Candidatus Auribacterota bacterium]|nr:hypothetical protein [Candidatus Auribacterota bacterium]
MAQIVHDAMTGLEIGDPAGKIFAGRENITREQKEKFLETTIFSVSGWRRICAADGDEESTTPEINILSKILFAGAARIFAQMLREKYAISAPVVALALDARHTGPKIGLVIIRALLAYGCKVRYSYIASAPEAMAYTKTTDDVYGFIYVSASHNPVGHNGIKYGLGDGAVLGKQAAQPLIDQFKECFFDAKWVESLMEAVDGVSDRDVAEVLKGVEENKKKSLKQYELFSNRVITGIDDTAKQKTMLDNIKGKIKNIGIGVLAELNGSARGVSIDIDYLKSMGLTVTALNSKPRQIVHRIVPEGISLNLAKEELLKLNANDGRYRFAYVPDCDGDRGNIVTIDRKGNPWVLEAQEVFALSVVSELAYLVYSGLLTYDDQGNPKQKAAVVVNGPTSGRIERIAHAFGAEVARAEVGEANVVSLALEKQQAGYIVRILGEGSNGGNITLPSTVRDPINTIFAFIKMLVLRSDNGKQGLFEIWCRRSGQMDRYCQNVELFNVAESLPTYITTSAFEDRAIVSIRTTDHARLKARYEAVLAHQWNSKKAELNEKLGVTTYKILNYEGSTVREGAGARTGTQSGGLKVSLEDNTGTQRAFIWMRGSGTEPVFRVLADVQGNDPQMEANLLNWHVAMIHEADKS